MTTTIPRPTPAPHWARITFDLLVEAMARTAVTMNPPMARSYRASLRPTRRESTAQVR
jgi:hypothetical protein